MLIFTSSSTLLSPPITAFWFLNAWKVFQPTAVEISFPLPCQNGRDQVKIIWVTTLWWGLCLHSWYEVANSPIWNANKVIVRTPRVDIHGQLWCLSSCFTSLPDWVLNVSSAPRAEWTDESKEMHQWINVVCLSTGSLGQFTGIARPEVSCRLTLAHHSAMQCPWKGVCGLSIVSLAFWTLGFVGWKGASARSLLGCKARSKVPVWKKIHKAKLR